MPSTNTDKIDDLHKFFGQVSLDTQLLEAELLRSVARIEQLERQIDPLRIENAVVKHEIAELKKAGDEWGRRLWGLVQILIGATVGAAFTYLLKR